MQALPQDIAATVAEEDRAAAARFVPASEARCLNLMAQNAELRQQLEDATSLTYSYAKLIGQQREDLRTLKGENATPQRGCQFHTTILGDAEVLVEYEYEPASGDGWNEPHEPATVTVLQLFINGKWCDASDILDEDRIEKIEVEIVEGMAEAAEDDKIDAYEANREWGEA
jgi:hypothetical protein